MPSERSEGMDGKALGDEMKDCGGIYLSIYSGRWEAVLWTDGRMNGWIDRGEPAAGSNEPAGGRGAFSSWPLTHSLTHIEPSPLPFTPIFIIIITTTIIYIYRLRKSKSNNLIYHTYIVWFDEISRNRQDKTRQDKTRRISII